MQVRTDAGSFSRLAPLVGLANLPTISSSLLIVWIGTSISGLDWLFLVTSIILGFAGALEASAILPGMV